MNKLERAAPQAFETWWESEGQEFLFALNTTTDDDIKLVAEVAWKNGAYCAEQADGEQWSSDDMAYRSGGLSMEQAEQDLDTCPGCGGVADNGHDREFPPNPYYCTKCIEQAEQEPVKREHITDGSPCWCNPELNYKDPETGAEVWVHKEPQ